MVMLLKGKKTTDECGLSLLWRSPGSAAHAARQVVAEGGWVAAGGGHPAMLPEIARLRLNSLLAMKRSPS